MRSAAVASMTAHTEARKTAHTRHMWQQNDERRETAFDISCGCELAKFACCPRG